VSEDVAVTGVGLTAGVERRDDTDIPGLLREAAHDALGHAELEPDDVDAILVGNAGEFFAGTNTPDLWGVGSVHGDGQPEMRIHTGGTAGASTGLAGFYHAASGLYDTVLAVTFEKLSDLPHAQVGLNTVYHPIFHRDHGGAGAPSAAGIQAQRYIHKYGGDETRKQAAKVAVKQREYAQDNPNAQLQLDITVDDVLASDMLSTPVRMLDSCPSTDGACAMVFETEDAAKATRDDPAWVHGVGAATEGINHPNRDWADPEACFVAADKCYDMAGIDDPYDEIDCVELYDAFSFQEPIWYEGLRFCERGEGGRLVDEGVTYRDGELPTNPSGGVLSCNPIGATAMIRQAEAALQTMGDAGGHQVPDVETSLAHGWGGYLQFHTAMLFDVDPPGVGS
jgi:acetyl-CoA C-acetyltransferase